MYCVTKDTPSGLGTSKCILWYIIYSPSGLTLLGIEFSDYWSSLNSIAFVIKPSVLYYVFPLYNQPLYCEYSMLALLLRGIKSFLYTTKIMRYNLIGFGRVSFLRSDIPHLWCLTTQNKIIFLPAVSSSFPFHGSTAKSPPIADYICVSSIVLTFGLRGQLRSGRCHQIWQGIIINTSHFRQ